MLSDVIPAHISATEAMATREDMHRIAHSEPIQSDMKRFRRLKKESVILTHIEINSQWDQEIPWDSGDKSLRAITGTT